MIVGAPKEIKPGEQRVALTPAGVRALAERSHDVLIEEGAGVGSGIRDDEYTALGARIVAADELWAKADLVLKVKEPMPPEVTQLRTGQALFTYLHLAADRALTDALRNTDAVLIAYETVQRPDGSLPLLTPMSEVAGRLAVQEGAFYLGRAHGGRGVLLGGVPGVPRGNVVILGAGVVGMNALRTAVGLGADVSIVDVNLDRLRHVEELYGNQVVTVMSNSYNIEQAVRRAELVIGGVLVAGARAPVLVTEEMVRSMKEARSADVRARRRRALRRDEHAGAGAAHVHVRAHQRDAAVRARARGPRRDQRDPQERRARERRQRLPRQARPSRRRRVRGRGADAARGVSRVVEGAGLSAS